MNKPLILLTNDDGIASPGLRAAVEAVMPLGELLIVAPKEQHTGASRHLRGYQKKLEQVEYVVNGTPITAYAANGTPSFAAHCAVMLIAPRLPDLTVSGINYGENVGSDVTMSGTVGAAIEAACFDIPALAMSLETDKEHHLSHSEDVSFDAAAFFTAYFAERMLNGGVSANVDLLSVNVPSIALPQTEWRLTRVSRHRYFYSVVEDDPQTGERHIRGYDSKVDKHTLEPDSDIWAMAVDRVVSVSPMTFDLTAADWHTLKIAD